MQYPKIRNRTESSRSPCDAYDEILIRKDLACARDPLRIIARLAEHKKRIPGPQGLHGVLYGRGVSDNIWDQMLRDGYYLNATAVDDMHTMDHAFQGWTNILAEENTPEAVMDALKNGRFYSSRGPEIYRISYENGILEAEFSPCTEVVIIGRYCYGYAFKLEHIPNADGTNEITSIKMDVSIYTPKDRCFRLQMFDRNHRYAWSNPIMVR